MAEKSEKIGIDEQLNDLDVSLDRISLPPKSPKRSSLSPSTKKSQTDKTVKIESNKKENNLDSYFTKILPYSMFNRF